MFLLFTKPDPRLSSETSVDPMGLQVVWTHYARGIFEDKVSTLITDARILTINLFHAYLLNELQENNRLVNATERFSSWKTDRDVRFGLLILMEDIFINVFYEQGEKGAVELGGLIGMIKANQAHRTRDQIRLRAEQNAGMLTRQIQLGMMGRNKGGMISMGLFNGDLILNPDIRIQIHELFKDWKGAMQLKESFFKFISGDVLKTTKNKQFPELHYETILSTPSFKAVRDGYMEVFGKRKLPKAVRDFWMDRLGFLSGASNAVYTVTGKLFPENTPVDPAKVMMQAHNALSKEPGEREKIEAILRVEPFLSLSDYVFRFIARKDVKRISDHEEELQLLRRQLEIDGSEERLQMDAKETHARLKELRSVMIAPERSLNDWVAEIVRYHSKVMTLRKNSAWLELQPGGTLKHVQSASLPEKVNTAKSFLKNRPWFHRYYVDSVQSLRELLNQ